jgi:hypothetical protein
VNSPPSKDNATFFESFMGESKVPVGSVTYWAATRFAQFLMICVGMLFFLTAKRPLPWQLALILVLWLFLAVYLDSSVYGFADEHGVHFGRYISMQFVPWRQIGRVCWFGSNILLFHLKAGNILRREMNANSSSSRSLFLNVEEEPELVRWLLLAKPSAADGLELRPWGVDTVASRKMPAVVKILVQVICAAILIWLLITVHSARG